MPRNQIIILGSVLLFFAILFAVIIGKKKEVEKDLKSVNNTVFIPIRKVKNEEKKVQIISYGQVTPNAQISVAFEVQGKLLQGAQYLKPGSSFKKGEVLYRIDDHEAQLSTSARKLQLANLVVSSLPDIELDFPSEIDKWKQFLDAIDPEKKLPEWPKMNSSKEKAFFISRGVSGEYYALKSQEARLEKYTFRAPFSGTVIATNAEPGAIANPGVAIAQIAKTGNYEVKVPISMEHLKAYQKESKVDFTTVEGVLIGTGSIHRISDVVNNQTQSVDVYYNLQPADGQMVYSGMYLNVAIDQETIENSIAVPRMAVTDNKISILKDSTVHLTPIRIVGSKPDSLYISGLRDGQQVVLDKIEIDTAGITFKGIMR